MSEANKNLKARLVAKVYLVPDLIEGVADTSGCVCFRSAHLQVASFRAIKKWEIWIRDIGNAFLSAAGFTRDVFLHVPLEWDSSRDRRIWKLYAPAYGLGDSTVAVRRPPRLYFLNSAESAETVSLRCQVTSLYPRFFFGIRGAGGAVGAFTTYIDDMRGCG